MPATVVGASALTKQSTGTQTQAVVARALGSGAITAGDELLLFVVGGSGGLAGASAAPTAPTGWTLVHSGANKKGFWLWRKTATSNDRTLGNGGDGDTFTIAYNLVTTSTPRDLAGLIAFRPATGETITWAVGTDSTINTNQTTFTSPSTNGGATNDLVVRWAVGTSSLTSTVKLQLDWAGAGTPAGTKQLEDTLFGYFVSVGTNPEAAPGGSAQQRTVALSNSDSSAASTVQQLGLTLIAVSSGPVAPTVTNAPAVAGSASVGATLTDTPGVYGGSPTPTVTRQWRRDGAAIGGATASTYLVSSADAGHTVDVLETATNASGSVTSASNGVAVPAAPTNTAVPTATALDGSTPSVWHTGDTVAFHVGAWTNATSYTVQVYRNTTSLTGSSQVGSATEYDYPLQSADEGQAVKVGVIAHGPGGDSTEVFSASITPAVTSPLGDSDGVWLYSNSVVGVNDNNVDPARSIGGARGGTIVDGAVGSLIGPIPGSVAQGGGDFYRGVYVRNAHPVATDPSTRLYVAQQPQDADGTASPIVVEVGVPQEAAGVDLPVLASQTTAPAGVTFAAPGSFAAGLAFGDLAAGVRRGVWLHFHVPAGTPADQAGAYFQIVVESQTA